MLNKEIKTIFITEPSLRLWAEMGQEKDNPYDVIPYIGPAKIEYINDDSFCGPYYDIVLPVKITSIDMGWMGTEQHPLRLTQQELDDLKYIEIKVNI